MTSPKDASAFAGALRAARTRASVSQREVARRMKCSPSTVVRVEAGKSALLESTVRRYAAALGLRVELLLVEEAPCPTTT